MIRRGLLFLPRFAWVPIFFLFLSNVSSLTKSVLKTRRKQMSDDDSSVTLHSESEMSEDSESECSIADFVADSDEEPEVCLSCHAEICVSNVINRKRRRTPVDHDCGSNDEESDSDSSSDYVPSEADVSSSDGSECSDAGSDAD